ncbi:esterase/lipase family protein [Kutzneria kofuensis]|uniref:Triacylglycerol esterase/lipase EstA (Alpha/beta hydrolase family) n=1 Tax=Kutzneria kofuensis TaxID=103725 RepID=A0A7W9KJ44_9PSEU|nr:alpha/beta fold hydrolase [Kutzneria kofuensis]MBB5893365.1 triacylglycerol esterase/lipase EstA (alpha/beta hydrolase family) [Kutzneria kofuensis]
MGNGVLGRLASTLRGVAVESAWLAAHAALYPWGAMAERLHPDGPYVHYRTDALSPTARGLLVSAMDAAGTPILLLHGIGDNRSVFAVLGAALRRRGFGVVHAVNYSVLTAVTGDVRTAASMFGEQVEQVCELTGSDRVHVVGHSLGGLIARYYVQRRGGDERVDTLVTLGTPHRGTVAAYLLPTGLARQLRPGSPLLAELDEPAPDCRTRFISVWTPSDQIVLPQSNARLTHPDLDIEEHCLRDVGHWALPVDSRASRLVANSLVRVHDRPSERATSQYTPLRTLPVTHGHSASSELSS